MKALWIVAKSFGWNKSDLLGLSQGELSYLLAEIKKESDEIKRGRHGR